MSEPGPRTRTAIDAIAPAAFRPAVYPFAVYPIYRPITPHARVRFLFFSFFGDFFHLAQKLKVYIERVSSLLLRMRS
jgi:hypothetical protein